MNAKHTPGPWECDDENDICAQNRLIAVAYMPTPASDDEWDANARLIAAAPELLEALQELVARCDGQEGVRADGSNIQTMYARAVLEKAEGK